MVYSCDSWKCGKYQPQRFGPVYVEKKVLETCVMGSSCISLHI